MPEYAELYPHEYDGPHFDWPAYRPVSEEEVPCVEHLRYENAALISMCDRYLGKVLDFMDSHDMWKDTMLLVNTDHGFLLGEHGWWAKGHVPFYQEIAHIPLFAWDPRVGCRGERRKALVQTIDLGPTLLEFFGLPIPKDMQGAPLRRVLEDDTPVHDAVLFGYFGGHVNCTDGRYVYMRAPVTPENGPLFEYTLMPTRMNRMFLPGELREIGLSGPFPFTKGCRVMQIPVQGENRQIEYGTLLFDLERDPGQTEPIQDAQAEDRMARLMARLMRQNDAPPEQFERLGL